MIWEKLTKRNAAQEHTVPGSLICIECGKEYGPDRKTCPKDGGLVVPRRQLEKTDRLVGSLFVERYNILSVLGEGGMSVVYKAHHTMMDRVVAIKILKNFESSQDKMLKRFQQEARAASSLSHPNLITIHDFGITHDGQAYLVMDYLEGLSLETILQKDGRLNAQRAGQIFMQVCDGLAHAHSKGIVHRDIKPSNIVIVKTAQQEEFVKIVDFGIAKLLPEANKETFHLTQAGQIFGSPLYMSPEQCANKKVDNRTDVYALGATMYNALSGGPPFDAATLAEVIYQHLKEDPTPLSKLDLKPPVADNLDKIVLRCMEKSPDSRFQSMAELRTEISVACNLQKKKATTPANMINVVIAEDNDELAASLTESIATAGGAFVSARARNGDEAIDKVMQHLPQVVLIDVKVPILSGVEVTKQLKTTSPNLRVLLFSVGDDPNEIISALNAGADGYILQDLSPSRLGPAIKAIVSGIPWIDPEITSGVLRNSGHAAGKNRALDTSTRTANNQNLDHSEYLETLGDVYVQEKKYDEAEALFHGAIALCEKAHGKDSPGLATVCTKLADLYMSRKKSAAAEQLYLRALEVRFHHLGHEHLDVAASLESLALLFKISGGFIEAERFYMWAIRIREKLQPTDESLAHAYSKLAGVYKSMNRAKDADMMEKRAGLIRENSLSETLAAER